MPSRKLSFVNYKKVLRRERRMSTGRRNCFSESISAVGGHSCLTLIRLPSSNTTTSYILQYISLFRVFHKTIHFIASIFYLFKNIKNWVSNFPRCCNRVYGSRENPQTTFFWWMMAFVSRYTTFRDVYTAPVLSGTIVVLCGYWGLIRYWPTD